MTALVRLDANLGVPFHSRVVKRDKGQTSSLFSAVFQLSRQQQTVDCDDFLVIALPPYRHTANHKPCTRELEILALLLVHILLLILCIISAPGVVSFPPCDRSLPGDVVVN